MAIIKKYVVAMDSQVPMLSNENIRVFMFGKDVMFDSIEEAEYSIGLHIKEGIIYAILPVYIKG